MNFSKLGLTHLSNDVNEVESHVGASLHILGIRAIALRFGTLLAVLCLILMVTTTVSAEEYSSGPGALERFDAEARATIPLALKAWLMVLVGTFAGSLFFAWKKPLARWALGGILVAMLAGHAFFALLGWPMLGGAIALWHIICWTPVLAYAIWKSPFLNKEEPHSYRIWSAMIVAVIIVSFVFDIRDSWIYLQHIFTR